jgi:hypothetical protein
MLIFNGMGTFLVPLVLGAYLVTSSPVGSQLVEDLRHSYDELTQE